MNDFAYSGARDRAYKQPIELAVLGHFWRICHLHATPDPLIATILIFLRGYSEGKTHDEVLLCSNELVGSPKGRGPLAEQVIASADRANPADDASARLPTPGCRHC
jgi:hypothetical protein